MLLFHIAEFLGADGSLLRLCGLHVDFLLQFQLLQAFHGIVIIHAGLIEGPCDVAFGIVFCQPCNRSGGDGRSFPDSGLCLADASVYQLLYVLIGF